MIIRGPKRGDFTQIDNIIFRCNLSFKAIGLLTYILHFPPNYSFNKASLCKNVKKDGRASIDSAWKELTEAGFIEGKKVYDAEKKHPIWDYIVNETPCESLKAGNQHLAKCVENQQNNVNNEKGKADFPKFAKPAANNTILYSNNIITSLSDLSNDKPDKEVPAKQVKTKKAQKKPLNDANTVSDTDAPRAKINGLPAPEKPVYSQFIDVYYQWFVNRVGDPPKIDAIQGKSAKAIIAYLRTVVKSRAKQQNITLDQPGEDLKIVEAWTSILDNWDLCDSFYRDKTRLMDINSNIQNIINQVRNGITKIREQQGIKKIGADGLQTAMQVAASRFRPGAGRTTGS